MLSPKSKRINANNGAINGKLDMDIDIDIDGRNSNNKNDENISE